jgi:hypothetical protein
MPALVFRAALVALSFGAARAAVFSLFADPACTVPSTNSTGTSAGGGSAGSGNLTAFFGACTDIALAYPITLTACTEGAAATLSIMYPLTSSYTLPPECAGAIGTLGFMVGAVGTCTPLALTLAGNFFRDAVAFKLVDAACALPPDVFYVTVPGNATCFINNDPTPAYRLSIADNTCRSVLGVNYKAVLGTSSPGAGGVAPYNLYLDAACATQGAAWPSVPFDRSCAQSAGPAGVPAGAPAGLRAVRPNAAVPPSPSASPAPYRAPLQERAAVLFTWPESNGGCDGAPDEAVRALTGVCTPSVDSMTPYDIGLTSCDASGVSFVVFNNTPATAGTCAGPVLYVGAAALGGCAFVQPYDATATNESFYVSLAAPAPCVAYAPATASLLTLYTGGSSSSGGPPPTSCAPGSPTITTLVPNTGGPGSCATAATALQTEDIARALANYSAQMVGDAVTIEFFNSTLPPYGCSGAGSRTGLPGAFIAVAVSARDGACVPVSIFGSPSLGGRVTPATAYNGPAPAPSSSPTPSFSPSTGTSPTPTPTVSRTAPRTLSATPSPPPTASLTASVPASPSTTPTAPSASPTPTASLSFGASPSVSPTATPSPSVTPTFTPTPQPTPAAPAGAAAAADVVGPAVGGTLGGLALVGIAGAGAAALIARRGPRSRLVAGGASSWRAGSALAKLNPLAKPAAASAPAAGAPAAGADAVTWTRYVDADDEWYVSSLGQTEWVLPAGAVVVAQPPA